jgi:hypothetical protein
MIEGSPALIFPGQTRNQAIEVRATLRSAWTCPSDSFVVELAWRNFRNPRDVTGKNGDPIPDSAFEFAGERWCDDQISSA